MSTCSAISSYNWKWSSNGWSYSYLDNTPCLSRSSSFFGTSSGHFFIRLTVTFNNGTTTTKNLTVIRQSGATFLINPNEEGTLFSDNPNNPLIEGIHLYPNPAKDIINIAFDNEHNSSSRIEILSHQGRLLKAIEIIDQQSNATVEIRIDDISPGMYFIRQYSKNNEGHKFGKFVKTQ